MPDAASTNSAAAGSEIASALQRPIQALSRERSSNAKNPDQTGEADQAMDTDAPGADPDLASAANRVCVLVAAAVEEMVGKDWQRSVYFTALIERVTASLLSDPAILEKLASRGQSSTPAQGGML